MIVRYWGTRGSLPTAIRAAAVRDKVIGALIAAEGRRFGTRDEAAAFVDESLEFPLRGTFGGASSCVEIDGADDGFVVCDLGSGLREFGIDSIGRTREGHSKVYNIFLSHLHWDHINGFPFFAPAYDPEVTLRFFGGHAELHRALERQQEQISFPVPLTVMNAKMEFTTLEPGRTYDIGRMRVSLIRQHHSNDSYGYRIESGGRTVVYSTDSEHKGDDLDNEKAFVDFFRDADLVTFDTMYSLAESVTMKEDWGHSSNVVAVDLCHRAGVRRLVMFHHEPAYDDEAIHRIHGETVRYEELMRQDSRLEVLCAYDGLEIAV